MDDPDFFDFLIEGGDELLNTERCPHCGATIYLDQRIEWTDESRRTCKCPSCRGNVELG